MAVQCTLATMEDEEVKQRKELLRNQVEDLKCSVAAILAENDVLDRFIGRLNLESEAGQRGPGAAGASQLEEEGRERRSLSNISGSLHRLTLEQKLYVAQTEVIQTQLDRERVKQRYEKTQDNFKASLEEAELRLAEIRRARSEFERRLPLKDGRLEMKPEKVLQCIEDKSKLEKFKLRNQLLKVHEKKLQQQLQQKKEMRKVEHEEIFQEYSEPRVEKDPQELQVSSLKAMRVVTSLKEALQKVTLESTELSDDISNRKKMLVKMEEELQRAEEERLGAEALNKRLRRQLADYQAPDVTAYIGVKDRHKKLQQSVHTWQRKVEITQRTLRSRVTAWNSERAAMRTGTLPRIPESST